MSTQGVRIHSTGIESQGKRYKTTVSSQTDYETPE